MADLKKKITDLTQGTPENNDFIPFVDVSDTTQSPEGSTKKAFKSELKGDTGDGATVTVGTTTTLDAGESATVVNSGTTSEAILDFGIPKGDKGDTGDTGADGATGADGNDGADGVVQALVGGTNVTIDSTDPANPIINASGGIAPVDSVNGQTGVVVLDTDDIAEGSNLYYTDTRVSNNSDVVANTAKVGITTPQTNAIIANTAKVTNATHTGEVTGSTALTIADNVIDEANLKLDEAPTNDYVLTADSSKSGGMKWAEASGGGGGAEYAMIKNQETSGGFLDVVVGGTVLLNEETYDTGNFITLSSNRFALLEGTYIVSGAYLTYDSGNDYGYIYNVSDSIVEYYGSIAASDSSDPSISTSHMNGLITVPSGGKTYELRSGVGRLGRVQVNSTGDQLTFIKIA